MSLGGGKGGDGKSLRKKPWEWDLLALEYLDNFNVAKLLPEVAHQNAFLDGWFNGSAATMRGCEFPQIADCGALARHIFANASTAQLEAILASQRVKLQLLTKAKKRG